MNMLIRFFILISLLKRQQTKTISKSVSKETLNQDTLLAPFSRSYRVLPHDMGFRNHLPNYRYLSFIELNIMGWLYKMLTQKGKGGMSINWIISMQEMVYLKEVRFLSKIQVISKLEGWDAKYLYFQHHFYVKNSLMAIGMTKFILVNKKGKLSPEVLDLKGEHLTEVMTTWNANQAAIKQQQQ